MWNRKRHRNRNAFYRGRLFSPLLSPLRAFFAVLLGVPTLCWASDALDVRIGQHPDKTRFVLELSDVPQFDIFTLADPYRVVIDLPDLDWSQAKHKRLDRKGLVKSLRYGNYRPGVSRIVLDLAGPGEVVSAFVLPPDGQNRHRLVVDIHPVSRGDYLARGLVNKRLSSLTPLPVGNWVEAPVLPGRRPVSEAARVARQAFATKKVIVIDAGHGGIDPGAIGVGGTQEKDLALLYALALKTVLEQSGRYRVVMTRAQDKSLALRERVMKAQKVNADLFVSLHANTHRNRKVSGASFYTLSESGSDKEADALAAKENKADVLIGVDLSTQSKVVSKILIDLAQRETNNQGKYFAGLLVDEFKRTTRLLNRPHRSAGFAVLKSPVVPSVLVELGYISNPQEEKLLSQRAHRQKLTGAIQRAITQYFRRLNALQN